MSTLAHLSDLHLGHSKDTEAALEGLVDRVRDVDTVLVTGDLTEHGRALEYATFRRLTAPLGDRLVVVPGNHDRCGDDIGGALMKGVRVDVVERGDQAIVRIDSTAPHNTIAWLSHGRLCDLVLSEVDAAIGRLASHPFVVVALHHHVVPLPAEGFWESVSEVLGLPNHSELTLGTELLRLLRGRCDLVLHGHRHVPRTFIVDRDLHRPMHVFNAGSSTELGACRVFEHAGAGLTTSKWRSLGTLDTTTSFAPAFALQLA